MSNSRFDILAAAQKSCLFAKRERRYLAAIGLFPLAMYAATAYMMFVAVADEKITYLQSAFMEIPAIVAAGWFMFLQTRLIVFGERVESLPKDASSALDRRRMMQQSLLTWLLINVVVFGFTAYMIESAIVAEKTGNGTLGILALVLVGVMVWAVRFGVAHILAAVGYPLKKYVYLVNGAGISFRLAALFLLINLPIMLLQLSVTESFKATGTDMLAKTGIIITYSFLSLISLSLTNAAFVYALKEILGREKGAIA